MNSLDFQFGGQSFLAFGEGGLYWPDFDMLIVSDLHLGKSERIARRGGQILPPYDCRDTLDRLDRLIGQTGATRILSLGDSFDDLQAWRNLAPEQRARIEALCEICDWVWIEGNHDPAPTGLRGTHHQQMSQGGIEFCHISGATGGPEISGHFHPKHSLSLRGRVVTRKCFLYDATRLIMPAFGTYTGGLATTEPVLGGLFPNGATAILTGAKPHAVPVAAQAVVTSGDSVAGSVTKDPPQ